MLLLELVLTFVSFINVSKALVKCNGTVTKQQLCSLDEVYNKGSSSACEWSGCHSEPMRIWSSVTVYNIAELNTHENTLKLDILLSIWWYDTRITLESNKLNE